MEKITDLQASSWSRLSRLLDRLPHALLIHGPQGVGKLALAERFAQLLVCERKQPGGQPCGQCDGCRWFLGGNHPDIRFLEPEALARAVPGADDVEDAPEPAKGAKPSAQIKIEQARALRDFVNVVSHRGGHRVVIVQIGRAHV